MSFAWDAKRFATLKDFIDYLWSLPKLNYGGGFPTRVIMHHTWKPTISEWRGMESMAALERYYRDEAPWTDAQGRPRKGWSAGPHLFVAWGSPAPEWDGIFQGTPITQPGIHALGCNLEIGIEVVGNFDLAPWSLPLESLLVGLVGAILDKQGIPVAGGVIGHRDCPSTKTCPGTKVSMERFRSLLVARGVDPWDAWGTKFPTPPLEQRPWDINQRWFERRSELGEARTHLVYLNDGKGTVVRLFERGLVVDDNDTRGKAWTFKELLK